MDIKKIREKAYLTQPKFAEELGVSVATIRAWEQKLTKPNITHRGRIKQFCKKHKIVCVEKEK